MADYPYQCQCKGCPNGHGSTFYHRPPEWFASKGITTLPKNCQDCKAWKNSQTDEAWRCTSCSRPTRTSAKYKITFHMKTGPWTPTTECMRCERGEKPPKSVDEEQRPKKKQQKKDDFHDLPIYNDALPRDLDTDLSKYQYMIPKPGGGFETRQEHIEHHLVGSPYSLTTMEAVQAAGLSPDDLKSWTSLASEAADITELLGNLAAFTMSVDYDYIREYRSGKEIIRITFTGDHDGLEKTVLKEQSDGTYGLVTSHDKVTLREAQRNLNRGRWH